MDCLSRRCNPSVDVEGSQRSASPDNRMRSRPPGQSLSLPSIEVTPIVLQTIYASKHGGSDFYKYSVSSSNTNDRRDSESAAGANSCSCMLSKIPLSRVLKMFSSHPASLAQIFHHARFRSCSLDSFRPAKSENFPSRRRAGADVSLLHTTSNSISLCTLWACSHFRTVASSVSVSSELLRFTLRSSLKRSPSTGYLSARVHFVRISLAADLCAVDLLTELVQYLPRSDFNREQSAEGSGI